MKTKPLKCLITILILSLTCLTGNSFGFSESDLQKLLSTKVCVKCDLSGADLLGEDLSGANLSQSDLTRADLGIANLTDANLTGANLTGAFLGIANLTDANLTGANLTKADLTGSHLTGVVFDGAILTGVIGADLTDAGLKRMAEESKKRREKRREKEKRRLANEKLSLQGIKPERQKEFLNIVLSYRDKYNNSTNEIKKTLQRKKRIKAFKSLFKSNLDFQYWVGKISSMDTNADGDASVGIVIDSTDEMKVGDALVSELAKQERDLHGVVFAESKVNWFIPGGVVLVNNNQKIKMDDDLFDTIAEMEVGDKVVFSGSFERHPEKQRGRAKGWYIHTANPTEKGAMTSPVFVVGYYDIQKVNK